MGEVYINGTIKSGIDYYKSLGMYAQYDSLGYKVSETERHFHNRERWFGKAASPSGETHVADRLGGGILTFQAVSGNNTFGSWVQILGSSDTPIISGYKYYDSHRFLITTTDSTSPFIIQAIAGESSELAARVTANAYTELAFISATNANDSGIGHLMSSRIPCGTKAWVRVCCVGQNAKVINFYFGLHEYEG